MITLPENDSETPALAVNHKQQLFFHATLPEANETYFMRKLL